jgi:hypothetical protein
MKITGAQLTVHLDNEKGSEKTKYSRLPHKLNTSLSEKSVSLIK